MIGAMVGVREAQHFEVDIWPDLSRRAEALVRIMARLGILALALVFVWAGLEFTRFAWNRTSNWPICRSGLSTSLGRWQASRGSHSRASRSSMRRASCSGSRDERYRFFRRSGGPCVVRRFIALLIVRVPVAFALGLACLPVLLIEPRLSMMTLAQETFNAYNSFILLSVPFFLLTANLMSIGGITDRLVALSRSMVGHWPGSLAQNQCRAERVFRRHLRSSTADAASQSKIFIAGAKQGGL